MRILISILFILNIILSQQVTEHDLKCSHAKTARAMLKNYQAPSASQSDYDVTYYDIDLRIEPNYSKRANGTTLKDGKVYGQVSIKGRALVQSLNTIDLDLSYILEVNSVKNMQGDDLTYNHYGDRLSVTLINTVNSDEVFEFVVDYEGRPQATGLGSFGFSEFPLNSGIPMIWSLSEPYGAREWWPCKDTPTDKADSVDISITVPNVPHNFIAASNGLLAEYETTYGWDTYHWQERYPIATYLVSIAVYPYSVFYDWYKYSPTDSMRLEYYVFPDNYDAVQPTYELTNDMIGAMAQRFGEYPFINEKYGHAEFVWGGGMEHQTLTSMGGHSESLIAHELGHQWWGDMVTCANFHHIWLNEGFATYSEALWYELRDDNLDAFKDDMAFNRDVWYSWRPGSVYVEDNTNVGRIFNGPLSYAKASWVVHMLRGVVGDDNFFNGIQEYGNRYRFESAVTEELQTVMEEISGKDLNYFFQRWIYGELYPIYEVVYDQPGSNLLIRITQDEHTDVFEMPIDINIIFTDGSEQLTKVHNSLREELFTIPIELGKTVETIELDPDDWILKKISEIKRDHLDNPTKPDDFKLYPIYPNPFNSEVTIKIFIDSEDDVKINIYDIEGRLVWEKSEYLTNGTHKITWNGIEKYGNKIPSGSYIIEVKTDDKNKTQKVVNVK